MLFNLYVKKQACHHHPVDQGLEVQEVQDPRVDQEVLWEVAQEDLEMVLEDSRVNSHQEASLELPRDLRVEVVVVGVETTTSRDINNSLIRINRLKTMLQRGLPTTRSITISTPTTSMVRVESRVSSHSSTPLNNSNSHNSSNNSRARQPHSRATQLEQQTHQSTHRPVRLTTARHGQSITDSRACTTRLTSSYSRLNNSQAGHSRQALVLYSNSRLYRHILRTTGG